MRRARRTSTRTGRSSIRRSGCRTATPACASTRAGAAGRRASSTTSRRARPGTSTTCIEWAGVQPWSNGKVGLIGISYYGMNQWQVAAEQPPHLAAICPWEGAADWYRDIHPPRRDPLDVLGQLVRQAGEDRPARRSASAAPATRSPGELVCGDETLVEDELAANRTDFGADDPRATRSTTTTTASAPPTGRGSPCRMLSAAQLGRPGTAPARQRRGLRRGAVRPEVARDARPRALDPLLHRLRRCEIQKRFFGHFLKGEDTGWDDQPPVLLQVRAGSTARSSSAPRRAGRSRAREWTDAAPRPRRARRCASDAGEATRPGRLRGARRRPDLHGRRR